MSDRLPVGPYRRISFGENASFPYYLIPFDKQGRCEGPETRRHLLDNAQQHSDIFLFSHGWNNDWKYATDRYEDFIHGFMKMRREHTLPVPSEYAPLLVGIFWPSLILVKDSEQAPKFAGDTIDDFSVAEERQTIREIAETLPDNVVERFYSLTQKDHLDATEAKELAVILQRKFRSSTEDPTKQNAPDPEEIVRIWQEMNTTKEETKKETLDFADFGTPGPGGATATTPQAASFFGDLVKSVLPRDAIRTATAWKMKDRAGTIGATGVSSLLLELLRRTSARIHLIGHSYGGKVVLSALCAPQDLPRPVTSVLLLQPAVNHLCFANKVPGTNRPGGYAATLSRVERPIFSTFSANDMPLTKTFHLGLRREEDFGEVRIAADGEPPSRYAALGGFGPREAGQRLIDIQLPPNVYTFADPAVRIYGLRGNNTISGHGDISNPSTWWALYNLMQR